MLVPRIANAKISALIAFLLTHFDFRFCVEGKRCRYVRFALRRSHLTSTTFLNAHGVSAAVLIVDRRVNQCIAKLGIDFRVEPERRESSKLAVVCSEANDTYEISFHRKGEKQRI